MSEMIDEGDVEVQEAPPAPAPVVVESVSVRELVEQVKAEAAASPAGGIYRENPEAFFGPVVAALIAAGVNKDGINPRAIHAYYTCLGLTDWVRTGQADVAWAMERKVRELKVQGADLDVAIQSKVAEVNGLKSSVARLAQHDSNRPTLIESISRLTNEIKASQMEFMVLQKQITSLGNLRPAI